MAWQWLLSRARLCEYCDWKHYPVCHSQVSSQSPNWSLHNNFSLVIWACRLPIKVHLRGRYSKSVSDVDDSDHTLGESDNCTLWFKATAPNVKVLWCKIVILLMRVTRGKAQERWLHKSAVQYWTRIWPVNMMHMISINDRWWQKMGTEQAWNCLHKH